MTRLTVAGLKDHYRALFAQHGDDPMAAQTSAEGQAFRYQKLLQIGDLRGRSVLEVGCGVGTLYPLLKRQFPSARYTGVDVVPEMIDCAARKHSDARFRCVDLTESDLDESFDYVLMSMLFNNRTDGAEDFLRELTERAFAHATVGLGFNFLSRYVNFSDDAMAYHDPAQVLTHCVERLSPKVAMEHHYARCDVAVFVYR
ncbi:MAG: trans-aconitate 2-methyltransferase [Gemmatimonadales bacterium]